MRCTSHSKLRYISHLFSQCDVRRIGLWGVVRPRDPTFRLTKDQIDFLNAQYQGEPFKKKTRPHKLAKGTTALPGDACGLRPRAFLIFLCRFKCLHFATQLHNIEEVSEECRTKEAAV